MAVSYTQGLSTDLILTEVEALLDWRGQVLRQCLFPAAQVKPTDSQAPSSLVMWCKKEAEKAALDRQIADKVILVHDALCRTARQVLEQSGLGVALTVELYDMFEMQFETYINHLKRLQQDVSNAGMSVDSVTGLRTAAGMRNDLKREQDRFDRKGTSFSLANIAIDAMQELQQKHDRRAMDAIYGGVAKVIARVLRSFDDAYFLGKGEFLVMLKHIEFMDACVVMDRLRNEISGTSIALPNNEKVKVTASFGVAEALSKENADALVENAKTALDKAKGEGGNRVQEYRETSALMQYAKDVSKF